MIAIYYGQLLWAVLISLGLFHLFKNRLTTKLKCKFSILAIACSLIPISNGLSISALLLGIFDLPSLLMVGLLTLNTFKTNKNQQAINTFWHLGGTCSAILIIPYLLGWPMLFEAGYSLFFSTVILAALWLVALHLNSAPVMLLLLIVTAAYSFDLSDGSNLWFYLGCANYLLVYALQLTAKAIIQLYQATKRLLTK